MKCEYCDLQDKNEDIIYADEDIVIAVKDKITTPGQITVYPKKHYPIMEMVPEDTLNKCVYAAKKVSMAVFESLEAQGTNILVRNGLSAGQSVPHFGIEIIPRREEDNLNLQWKGKEVLEDEMDMILEAIEMDLKKPSMAEAKEEIIVDKGETQAVLEKEGDNYLLKSLKRIP
ncbi:hypothetical protein COV12_00275 [Candidatus Woesearchaeota archaeon CG10_big_fil_rev_8_21_14_0_10_32_24]|nr:MAG: hypothetical protein COV12_00275 [Candidatus Woesearchaeota archaeon CG10_big_fil_rev_8_21_14_0_10_32_24]